MPATRSSALRVRSAALAAALVITASACRANASTTDASAAESVDTIVDGSTLWTSADGEVSMEIDPTWTDERPTEDPLGEWTIGGPIGASLSVIDLPGIANVQDLLDATVSQLPDAGTFTVIDSSVRKGPHGSDIGYLEYSGEFETTPGVEVHIVSVFNVADGHAVAAIFGASEAEHASMSGSVIPYMETIRAL